MHVLTASHDLYPDPGSGGTGRYVYETARRLVDRGHTVSVVTRRRGDQPLTETVAGIDVYRYDLEIADRHAPAVLAQVPAAARTVSRHVSGLDPDLVSFQGPVTASLVHRAADDAVPRRCTFHSPWPTEYRLRTRDGDLARPRRRLNVALRHGIERSLLARAAEVQTLSEFMRDRLRDRYAPSAPTTVVPGGVDLDRFSPDAGRFPPVETDGTAFLTVRRLSPRMGHDLLLEAFTSVAERRPDASLFVAGDGPLEGSLREYAADLGIADRTHFLGYVPDQDLAAAHATADVFVLPTTELEGFGLATLEALAAGTPVVATPVGATVELLRDCQVRGDVPETLLLPSVDADALAERLCAWAALPEADRTAAGRACRAYAREHYAWESTVDAVEDHYATLVDDAARGRPRAASRLVETSQR